jgi:hypothetical protein
MLMLTEKYPRNIPSKIVERDYIYHSEKNHKYDYKVDEERTHVHLCSTRYSVFCLASRGYVGELHPTKVA